MKKRITVFILALLMVLALVPTVAMAAGEMYITNSDELADAILHQADGQTWILSSNTTYDLDLAQMEKYKTITINGAPTVAVPPGFVFPITANGLTIKGGAGTVIKSSAVVNSGNWHNQNFITIAGNNVTLDGLTLIPNENQYYWDSNGANKIIEVLGTGSVIKNLRTQARNNGDFSGSIYYSNTNSTDTLENVYLSKGRISLSGKVNGKLIMNTVTIDFTDALVSSPDWTGFNSKAGVTFETTNVTLLMNEHRMGLFSAMANKPDFGETEVTAAVDPTFTIVIPSAVNLGTLQKGIVPTPQTFNVTAQNVLIEASKSIVVSVTSDFNLANGTALLAYKLFSGSTELATGNAFATFTANGTQNGSVTVPDTSGITKAGSYQDTMTFTIAYQ